VGGECGPAVAPAPKNHGCGRLAEAEREVRAALGGQRPRSAAGGGRAGAAGSGPRGPRFALLEGLAGLTPRGPCG
jgi:hypothetical protein